MKPCKGYSLISSLLYSLTLSFSGGTVNKIPDHGQQRPQIIKTFQSFQAPRNYTQAYLGFFLGPLSLYVETSVTYPYGYDFLHLKLLVTPYSAKCNISQTDTLHLNILSLAIVSLIYSYSDYSSTAQQQNSFSIKGRRDKTEHVASAGRDSRVRSDGGRRPGALAAKYQREFMRKAKCLCTCWNTPCLHSRVGVGHDLL